MLKRVVVALVLVAVGAGAAAIVFAAFIEPHQATGTVNTAVSGTEALYICQPSGTTVTPQCPIDTAGADETIFAANEDLLAGSVEWQKIRVTNVGSDPWDILSMTPNWTETSDPSGLCNVIPEGVTFPQEVTTFSTSTGPGVTILGKIGSGIFQDPIENVSYPNATNNDNHLQVAESKQFQTLHDGISVGPTFVSVHVAAGDYEDLLLGIRLPIGTPDDCLNVVWTLTTTWEVQTHSP